MSRWSGVDEAAACRVLADLVASLVTASRDGVSYERLAGLLGVAESTVRDWVTGRDGLTSVHLLGLARVRGYRLVIVDEFGGDVWVPLVRERGEDRDVFELRRMVVTLRGLRKGGVPRRSQAEVARSAGVSRVSVVHWEGGLVPPRALSLVGWVTALGCRLALRPVRGSPWRAEQGWT